jgi:hypothetical protein
VNAVWQFTGPALAQFEATFLPSVAPDWNVIAFGDINGDGVNDVVWMQPSTGQVAIWLVSSPSTVITATYPARLGASTHLVLAGAGDIDGNGRAELLWRDSVTGELLVWDLSAAGVIASTRSYGVVPTEWELRGIGDFNADGIDDLLWYRASDGAVSQWLMAADGTFTGTFAGAVGAGTWRPQRVADFDGDGMADIFWRDENTGLTAVWYMNGGTIDGFDFLSTAPVAEWQLGAVGDFDLDGVSDLLWYAPSSGTAARWTLHGRHATPTYEMLGVGTNWYMP